MIAQIPAAAVVQGTNQRTGMFEAPAMNGDSGRTKPMKRPKISVLPPCAP